MTISTHLRKAGPFEGDGRVRLFPFEFKVFETKDLQVTYTPTDKNEKVLELGGDYHVTLSQDQEQAPGGSVTLNNTLLKGELVTLSSRMDYLQPVKITNQGGFYPAVLNDALDRLTIYAQQLAEEVSRTVKVNISEDLKPDALVSELRNSTEKALASAKVAAESEHYLKSVALGVHAIEPLNRYDGAPLQLGDFYYNAKTLKPYIFTSLGWVETIADSYQSLNESIDNLALTKADKSQILPPNFLISPFTQLPEKEINAVIYVIDRCEIYEWVSTARFQGYRSPRIGMVEDEGIDQLRAWQVEAQGGIFRKNDPAMSRLWAWAQEKNLTVPGSNWTPKCFQFADVDANSFRVPDLSNVFKRYIGTNYDNNSARRVGTYQQDMFRNHVHGYQITGFNNRPHWGPDWTNKGEWTYWTDTGWAGGAETRGENIALAPRLHI